MQIEGAGRLGSPLISTYNVLAHPTLLLVPPFSPVLASIVLAGSFTLAFILSSSSWPLGAPNDPQRIADPLRRTAAENVFMIIRRLPGDSFHMGTAGSPVRPAILPAKGAHS